MLGSVHVGIIGAGAIGGQLAALLDRSGVRVSVTARGEGLIALQEHGLRLTGKTGEHVARVQASSRIPEDDPPDLVIITTKAADTAAAIADNPVSKDVPVLVVQNGLDAHSRLAEIVQHDRVAAGISTTAANSLQPGQVSVTAAGRLFIGGPERRRFAQLLSPAVPDVTEIENLVGAQWTKLVINMVNAPPAVVDLSVQESIANPHVRRIITASMRETARIGLAVGVRFEPLQGLTPRLIRMIARAPYWVSEYAPRRMARTMGEVPNLGSTQQSLRRGKPTEVGILNGAVVQAAAEAGLSAPVNAAITRLVHDREDGGPALTPAAFRRAVTG